MWKPDPESLDELFDRYSEVLAITAMFGGGSLGIVVSLLVGNNPALALVGTIVGIIIGFISWLLFGIALIHWSHHNIQPDFLYEEEERSGKLTERYKENPSQGIVLGWAHQNNEEDFLYEEVRGEELTERYKDYPSCGNYIVTKFCDVYSPQGTDDIRIVIDMPGYEYYIDYDYPYSWDEDFPGLVELMEKRGIDPYEFNELTGEPVLVKTAKGSSTEFDVYNPRHPEEKIRDLYRKNQLAVEEVDVKEIQSKFEISLPWDVIESDEIVAEDGAVYNYLDSMR